MTRSRRIAALLLLVLGLAAGCGRAGPPVRRPRAPAAPAVQAPEPAADESEEKKEEEPK